VDVVVESGIDVPFGSEAVAACCFCLLALEMSAGHRAARAHRSGRAVFVRPGRGGVSENRASLGPVVKRRPWPCAQRAAGIIGGPEGKTSRLSRQAR
jgi:hypothetical protein